MKNNFKRGEVENILKVQREKTVQGVLVSLVLIGMFKESFLQALSDEILTKEDHKVKF